MISPGKAATAARHLEAQALVTVTACGPKRGLAGIKLVGVTGSGSGE
jgi:hypothetical protein